ncbi:MinD/ParA family protein [Thermosulfuriphilus sp.]
MDQMTGSWRAMKPPIETQWQRGPETGPRVISFTSGKGGVGKTNIVANLALALARLGKRVLIFDADLGLANIDVLLGLSPRFNINHVFSGQKALVDILVDGPGGIKILPASSGIEQLCRLNESQKLFLLGEFDHLGALFDLLLIDTSAGISENVIYFNLAAQHRVVVVTPEPTSITDAYALVKVMATRYGTKDFFILVNQVRSAREAARVYEQILRVTDQFLGPSVSLRFLGFLPKDNHLCRAVRNQKAVVEAYPQATISQTFTDLARKLLEEEMGDYVDGSIKFFGRSLLGV